MVIENFSTQPICEFYLSPAGRDLWGVDLWGDDCLEPQNRRALSIDESSVNTESIYDITVIRADGSRITYLAVNLSLFPFISLGDFGAELFEADPGPAGQ